MDYHKTYRKYNEILTESYRIAEIINEEISKLNPDEKLFDFSSADFPPKIDNQGVIFSKMSSDVKYNHTERNINKSFTCTTWLIPSGFFSLTFPNLKLAIKRDYEKGLNGWKVEETVK